MVPMRGSAITSPARAGGRFSVNLFPLSLDVAPKASGRTADHAALLARGCKDLGVGERAVKTAPRLRAPR